LLALRQLAEHVGGLVNPAALLAHPSASPPERLPEARSAVGNGELRRDCEAASASSKSPVEMPFRLRMGSRTSRLLERRA
jgi:hypothetical protein